jgi:hypothetical protein
MGDVLEIEVDGRPVDEAPRSGRAAPTWGLPAAIAVAGLLAIAVLVVAVFPVLTRGPDTQPPPSSATPADTNLASTAVTVEGDERVAAAEAALTAWGQFAVTGDVELLEGSFDTTGPQYRALVDEAAAIAADPPGPPPYDVELETASVEEASANEAVVAVAVAWARPGEPDQRFAWNLVMRRSQTGQWLLWTVRVRPA